MDQLTFDNSASLLKANGFAPIPLSDSGLPLGPVYVTQINWTRNAESPVAVLTSVPMPQGPLSPFLNASDTWLATVTVKVRDELKDEVDAIVKRHIGSAKCPAVRIADGAAMYVFKLAGGQFSTITTAYGHQPDTVRVESAASFIPLNGDWRDGISLLDITRAELAPLGRDSAQALVDEVDRLLDAHAPPVEPPAPFAPRPLLAPGQRLLYGNARAMDALREHGFQPLPIRWGHDAVERDGFNDSLGQFQSNVDVSKHGVGVNLKGFAVVEFVTRSRADAAAEIRAMGSCLIRTVRGDDRPAYLFRCDQGGADEILYSPNVHLKVRRTGALVLSGADNKGRAYQWDRDVLTVKASELRTFERHDGQRLQRLLEALPADYGKGSGKRRKAAA